MSAGDCISGAAYVEAATDQANAIRTQAMIEAALNIAIALWQRNSSKSIANMQESIAKRNIRLAREAFEHAKKFWDCQKSIVNWAFGENKLQPDPFPRYSQYMNIGFREFFDGLEHWDEDVDRHCLPQNNDCEMTRWYCHEAAFVADLSSFAARQEEAQAQSLNDRRYSRQYSVLSLGKGFMNNVASFSQIHGVAGLSAGALLNGAINSGLQAVGYHLNRERVPRWDGSPDTYSLPYRTDREASKLGKPDGYEVTVGTVKDEPIESCVMPSLEEQRRNPESYTEYLKCMGRIR